MARRLGRMVMPLWPAMLVSILAGVAGQLAAIGLLGTGALLLASVAGAPTGWGRQTLMAAVAACAVARAGLGYVEHYFGHDVAFRLLAMIRGRIFDALRWLAPARLMDKRSGDLVSTIMGDVEYVEVFFAHTIAPVTIGILVPASVLWFAGSLWPGFALILFPAYLALGVLLPRFTHERARRYGREYRQGLGAMNSHLVDTLHGLRELLLYGRGQARLEETRSLNRAADLALSRLRRHEGRVLAAVDAVIIAASSAVLLAGIPRVGAGWLTAGELLLITVVAASSFGPVVALSAVANTLMQTLAAAERIFGLLDESPAVEEDQGRAISPGEAADTVAYRQVSFRYPGLLDPVLSSLDLEARPAAKVAVVGQSGSGKTTAFRLLLRFWDAQEGSITRGAADVRHLQPSSLRAYTGVVAQDTFLFEGTVADNIRLGRPGATDLEVAEASRRAALDALVASLPDGYRTEVGELGGKLSAGERQRLSLARALLVGAPVIVLDEPTSHLDVLNEKRILMTLDEEFAAETVLVVSHRPSTVAGADLIYVVEAGSVVDVGRHHQLLQTSSAYSRLMNMSSTSTL